MTQTPSSRPARAGASGATAKSDSGASQGVADQAQDAVGQVVDQAQQTASQVTGQAKQQATSQVESQKTQLVDTLVTVSQALRQTGQHLTEQQQGTVARYVEQTAERVEGATNYLRARDARALLDDTQQLARREPALFLAGALALGFVGARFLMSSGQRQHEPSSRGQAPYGYGPSGSRSAAPAGGQPMAYPVTGMAGSTVSPARSPGAVATPGQPGHATPPPTLGRPEPPSTLGGRGDPLEGSPADPRLGMGTREPPRA
jgi:hypothetical protein